MFYFSYQHSKASSIRSMGLKGNPSNFTNKIHMPTKYSHAPTIGETKEGKLENMVKTYMQVHTLAFISYYKPIHASSYIGCCISIATS